MRRIILCLIIFLSALWIMASSASADGVIGEGPVIAPSPTPPYIIIPGDPMPRLYIEYYLPSIQKAQ